MIGIIDYNAGNIKSVERALSYLNIEYLLSKNPKDLEKADKVIFPGVGEAKYAMDQLKKSGFDLFLKDYASSGKKILGICLGSQIIFEHSEEGDTDCLGLLKGKIQHFSNLFDKAGIDKSHYKVPQIGFNDISFSKDNNAKDDPIFSGIKELSSFYFVHSYVIQAENPGDVIASCDYGIKVPSAIHHENIYAFQFHPEKSGQVGLNLLKNFCTLGDSSC
ncbi:MAG: imidazole glycerol phosphate synthase subunit HisH [Treponemataceae bacterium]|nr:imidazole glycerol phosphate synthase subunit HisH [Treponemataceae bacterium]